MVNNFVSKFVLILFLFATNAFSQIIINAPQNQPVGQIFKDAFDSVPLEGATVVIPSGVYWIEDTFRPLSIKPNTHIQGQGKPYLKATDTYGNPTNVGSGILSFDNSNHVSIDNIGFDVNANTNFSISLQIRGLNTPLNGIRVTRCHFKNSNFDPSTQQGWTIMAVNASNLEDAWFVDNHSEHCQFKLNGGDNNAKNIIFRGNIIKESLAQGVSVVANTTTEDATQSNILIDSNVFIGTKESDIYFGDDNQSLFPVNNYNIIVSNNAISEHGLHGSGYSSFGIFGRLTGKSENINIIGNAIDGLALQQGIRLSGQSDDSTLILGNTIRNPGNYGVWLRSSLGNSLVLGNYIINNSRGIGTELGTDIGVFANFVNGGTTGIELQGTPNPLMALNILKNQSGIASAGIASWNSGGEIISTRIWGNTIIGTPNQGIGYSGHTTLGVQTHFIWSNYLNEAIAPIDVLTWKPTPVVDLYTRDNVGYDRIKW